MKKVLSFGLLIAVLITTMTACGIGGADPDKVFATIAVKSNKIPRNFKQHFKEIQGQKANGSLTYVAQDNTVKKGVSATEYVEHVYRPLFDKDIKAIKDLKSDDESKPLIEAGLAMFEHADQIYKTDFPRIAKLIDEGKSKEEIAAAVEELSATKGAALQEQKSNVLRNMLPYADKHGVKYQVKDYPF